MCLQSAPSPPPIPPLCLGLGIKEVSVSVRKVKTLSVPGMGQGLQGWGVLEEMKSG